MPDLLSDNITIVQEGEEEEEEDNDDDERNKVVKNSPVTGSRSSRSRKRDMVADPPSTTTTTAATTTTDRGDGLETRSAQPTLGLAGAAGAIAAGGRQSSTSHGQQRQPQGKGRERSWRVCAWGPNRSSWVYPLWVSKLHFTSVTVPSDREGLCLLCYVAGLS